MCGALLFSVVYKPCDFRVYGWSAARAKEISRKLHVGDSIQSIDGRTITRLADMQVGLIVFSN